ncbi:MAG TPA: LamG-like jellyroll fold domain-containing protein, partial [Saprospiraceae bacterium]|nr:LamG-like jellyroll fold domain-containing protein [Saprospiraceae bacterium]
MFPSPISPARVLLYTAFSIIFLLFLPLKTFAQQWMENGKDASGNLNFYKVQENFNAYWAVEGTPEKREKEKKGRGEYKAFKRWENYWQHRVNADGSFPPPDIAIRNFGSYLKENPQRSQRYHQAAWSSLGPTTTPGGYPGIGRINAVCFDPTNSNIMWVGSPSGGLWKSTNSGSTWTTNSDNFTILGVSGIVINPVDPNIMYIATGDCDAGDNYSIGVMKSTNGGSTWSTTGLIWPVSNNNRIYRILMDQNDVNTILVATNSGIYVTHDAGANWTNKISGLFYDIRPNPNAASNMYYATDGDKIYKSTNDGDTWTLKFDIPGTNFRSALAVTAADPNVVYGLVWNGTSRVIKSTDAGETFNTQSTSPNILDGTADGSGLVANQGWYDICITVDPTNASIVYTGGITTWKSTNSGVNWTLNNFWYDLGNGTPVVHADKHVFEWQNNTTLWSGNDGGVYKTTNGGTSWASFSNGLIISQMYRLGTSQTDTKVITGLQDNGTKLKNTAGIWSDLTGGDGMECTINPVNSSIMYGTIQNGEQLNRSLDGGLTWVNIRNNIPGQPSGDWITPHALDPSNPSTIYAGYVALWKSIDQGDTWTSIGPTTTYTKTIVEVSASDPNVIVTQDALGDIYRTTNGGSSWSLLTDPGFFVMIEIHPTDPLIMWGVLQNYSAGYKVFKTIDGGANWTNISGTLPNLPANTIVYDKNSNGGLYVGMDVGIYYRDNTLSDWILYSAQLPNVEVYELEINYTEHKLYAATYGRGLWKSDLYEYEFKVEGNKTICADFNWTYNVENVPGATSYTWTLPSGWSGTSATNSITVDPSNTSGNVQCVVGLPAGDRTYILNVTVNANCNTAMDMDGVNDYMEPASTVNIANTSFTVEFWAKRSSIGTNDFVVSQGTNSTNNRLHIGFRNSNQFTFAFYGNDLNAAGTYTDFNWHHWSCVYDNSIVSPGHNRFIYRDGVLVGSDRSSSDLLASGVLHIGKYDGDYFGGKIDELRIWNVARTQSEIQGNLFCPLLAPPSSLKLYLPFEDGVPGGNNSFDTETIDFSGNSNHGYLNNFALNGATSNFTTGTDITRYQDSDGDGYGNPSVSTTAFCPAGTYVMIAGDCDDSNANINPYAIEVCANTVDDDCDDNTDVEINKALHFAASGGNKVTLPLLAHTQFFTVEAWIKVPAGSTFRRIIYWGGGPTAAELVVYTDNRIAYFEGGGNLGGIVADDQWHHVALVHNGYGTNNIFIYVDGVQSMNATWNNVITATSLTLGADNGGGANLNGTLDDVRFWSTVLTPAQIQSRMNIRLEGNETNLVRYYTFDHGKPGMTNSVMTIAKDRTSNNAHGTLSGFALTGSTSNWVAGRTYPTPYVDSDGDGFGGTSTWSCGPMTGYVLNNIDCNDGIATINPYASELCSNSADDDCDGNTDLEVNKALNYDGTNDWVTVPIWPHQSAFTVEAWIKVASGSTNRYILSWQGTNSAQIAVSGSNLLAYYENGGGVHGGINIGDNQWHHIAVVRNGIGTNNVTTYIDGNVAWTSTINYSSLSTSLLTLGANNGGNGVLNGALDEVRIWSVALTQAQIQARQNIRLDGNETNLVRYYTFDHGKPGLDNTAMNIVKDKTSNNAHGTLMGFALTGSTSNWAAGRTYPLLYTDVDGDSYGGTSVWSCGSMTGFVQNNVDCNDGNASINPYASEVCSNSIDDDCDGNSDLLINKALHFDGDDDQVITSPNFLRPGEMTFEAWIKTGTSDRHIASWKGAANGHTVEIYISGSNYLLYGEWDGNAWEPYHNGPVITDNQWHHVAVVRSVSGGNVKTYIDGILSVNSTISRNPVADVFVLGNLSGNNFQGSMDEVRVWNTTLTQSQIQSRMNRRLDGNEPNLIRYYNFDHGKPGLANPYLTILKDKTSNSANGTLSGFALTGATSNWTTSFSYPALYADADGDGFGGNTTWTCGTMAGYKTNNLDCNDANSAISPNAADICGNATDENCNGVNDENTLALNLDGVNDNVSFGNSLGNFGSGDFTIESRIKTTVSGRYILSKRPVCGLENLWNIQINGSGKLVLEMYENSSNTTNGGAVSSATSINDGNWHQFAITRKTGAIKIYIDGVIDGSGTLITNINNAVNLNLGSNPCGNPYGGAIDELRIWNVARTADEINDFKNASIPATVAGLIAYYDFNHPTAIGSGTNTGLTLLDDRTASNYDGTLTGFALTGATSNWIGNPGTTLTWYADVDGDTYGNPASSVNRCYQPAGYVSNSNDCDDTKAGVHPGATESCANNYDDNCDGTINELCPDLDLDGYTAEQGDCNDNNNAIHPGAPELCNGIDDDCDMLIDEGVLITYYRDMDNDTYGNLNVTILACSPPSGYVANSTDCNDNNVNIHPGATELCNDIDDDCDGSVDEGIPTNTYYQDADADGYGNANVTIQKCNQPSGYVTNNTDCQDHNAAIHPLATEGLNGIDDDCDGTVDEGATGIPVTGITQPCFAFIEDSIKRFMTHYDIPAMNVVFGKNEKLYYKRAFGYADLANTQPSEPYNKGRIASVSKPVTMLGILKLIQEGHLHFSDKVFGPGSILGDDPYYGGYTDMRINDITVQHLFDHTAGFDREFMDCFPSPADPYDWSYNGCDPIAVPLTVTKILNEPNPVSKKALIKFLLLEGLKHDPGTFYSYSNIGYLILGRIITEVSGVEYETYLRESIMHQVGVCDMAVGGNYLSEKQEREFEYRGQGTQLDIDGSGHFIQQAYGAGNINAGEAHGGWIATARDLAALFSASNGLSGHPDILNSTVLPYMAQAFGGAWNAHNSYWYGGNSGNIFAWTQPIRKDGLPGFDNEFFGGMATWVFANMPACASYDLMLAPIENSDDFVFTGLQATSANVAWTAGSGNKRLVVVKQGSPVDAFPLDGLNYTANAAYSSGTNLGNNNFVLYDGSGTNFTVTNLTPGTRYYFRVFEYNQNAATGDYSLYKLCECGTAVMSTGIVTGSVSGPICAGNSTTVTFTSTGITFNAGNTFTAQLSNGSGDFSSPVSIGTISSTSANGSISCAIPANTPEGSGYRIRVVSSDPVSTGVDNGSNIVINELKTWYADSDGDGFGKTTPTQQSCTQPSGYVLNSNDCNDNSTAINPFAVELCGTGVDENCDGQIDAFPNVALQFDGVDDYVSAASFQRPATMTVEAWLKVSNNTAFDQVVGWSNNTNYYARCFVQNGSLWYTEYSGPTNNYQQLGSWFIGDNNWHHVALVRNGTGSGNVTIYVDGVLRLTGTVNQTFTTDDFRIGAFKWLGNEADFFAGSMDELRIWNTARTLTEINANMNVDLFGNEVGLLRYWDFNQGNPGNNNAGLISLRDKSPNTSHGTLKNFALTGSASNYISGNASQQIIREGTDADGDGFTSCFDCNDGNANINPYAAEVCGNSIDDDCDSNTDLEVNKALHFDGVNDRVSIPVSPILSVFTAEAWIKVTSGNTWRRIISWEGTNSASINVSDANLLGYLENGGGVHGGPIIGDNQWHHVAVVRNGNGSNNITAYVDGSVALTATLSNVLTTSLLTFGAESSGVAGINGSLDEIRIWNAALTQSQIQSRMNVRLDGNETNLLRYYTFDHGKPGLDNAPITMLKDKTSNSAHGALNGFSLSGATSNWVTSWTYPTLYADSDSDGYGSTTAWTCGTMTGYKSNNLDCNDTNAAIKPGATDVCGNGIDENCNGVTDENTLSLNLDGSDDAVDLGATLGNFGTNNFTIEMRFKGTGTNKAIISKRLTCDCANFWNLKMDGNGKAMFEILENGCSNGTTLFSTTSVNDGNWHHAAISRTGTTVRLYIDGVLETTGTAAANISNAATTQLGNGPCASDNLTGEIDEVRIWNVARSSSDINSFKNASLPANLPGLVANFDFNNPNAIAGGNNAGQTTLDDRTSNNNDGTLNNFALNGTTSNWVGNPGTTMNWYADADGDTYGNPAILIVSCTQPMGYVNNNLDCNDTNANINPGETEIPGNGIDDDCDGAADESSSLTWVLLPNGSVNGSCTSSTDCCTQTFCYGLKFTPGSTGILTTYTTGFFIDCIPAGSPINSNVSCVMNDISNQINGCVANGHVLFNSSGNSGTLNVVAGVPVILHKLCLTIPNGVSLNITKDPITNLTFSIDGVEMFVTELPVFAPVIAKGNLPPVLSAGTISACYPSVGAAQIAAMAATTATDDCPGSISMVAVTSGTCSAVVTVTAMDVCGLTSSVMYNTRIDNTAPVITSGTIAACYSSVEAAEAAALAATSGEDNCPGPVTEMVSTTGTCSAVVTVTESDGCGNVSTKVYNTTIYTTPPSQFGGPVSISGNVQCFSNAVPPTLPVFHDQCGNVVDPTTGSPVITGTATSNSDCGGTVIYTYTYTDCAGLSTNWVYTYTLLHTTAPAQVGGPVSNSSTVQCASGILAPATLPVVKDVCGNTLSPTGAPAVGGTYSTCEGTKTYTYSYEDCSGLSYAWTYTYTIDHTTAPAEVGGPVAIASTVQCASSATAPAILPVVKDICGVTLSPTGSPAVGGTYVDCEGTKTYTYSYADCSGLTFTWTYTYTIDHTTAPAEVGGPVAIASTVQCASSATAPATLPVVKDVCGVTLSPTGAPAIGGTYTTCEGTKTYTYSYVDCSGLPYTWTYTYTIDHTTAPAEVGGPVSISGTVECASAAVEPTMLPMIKDVCGTTLTGTLISTVNTPNPVICEGTRAYTYRYTDCSGLTFDWTYTYTIDHTTAPTQVGGPVSIASTVQCASSASAPATLPIVKDVCGTTLTGTLLSTVNTPNPVTCEGTRVYTYRFTDCSGLTFDWTYTYTIDHTTAPTEVGGPVQIASTVQCASSVTEPTTLPVVKDVCGVTL